MSLTLRISSNAKLRLRPQQYEPPAHYSRMKLEHIMDLLYSRLLHILCHVEYFDNGYMGNGGSEVFPSPVDFIYVLCQPKITPLKGLHVTMRYYELFVLQSHPEQQGLEELCIDYQFDTLPPDLIPSIGISPVPLLPLTLPALQYLSVVAAMFCPALPVIKEWTLPSLSHFACRPGHTPEVDLQASLQKFGANLRRLVLGGRFIVSGVQLDLQNLTPLLEIFEVELAPEVPWPDDHNSLTQVIIHSPSHAFTGSSLQVHLAGLINDICNYCGRWPKLRSIMDTTEPDTCSRLFCNCTDDPLGMQTVQRLEKMGIAVYRINSHLNIVPYSEVEEPLLAAAPSYPTDGYYWQMRAQLFTLFT
ncbi:hypothetical protein M422DRAFT_249342 [Sphaerobolus stellatus SS14]|uniref:Uncharacterized protein n=1 Tax=Sphaerobolus stellatus (strain SS14) TaxID=990650 RepID=A0A0C9UVG7_SPHS4|nr:hypothetical protein M422DRAFT_249342 [Sphaerobolus stellatus SS14]